MFSVQTCVIVKGIKRLGVSSKFFETKDEAIALLKELFDLLSDDTISEYKAKKSDEKEKTLESLYKDLVSFKNEASVVFSDNEIIIGVARCYINEQRLNYQGHSF